jgi:hypothetical protein
LISADRTTEGVLVVFSDNKTILFKTDFLYRNRNSNGNEDSTRTFQTCWIDPLLIPFSRTEVEREFSYDASARTTSQDL